MILYVVFILIQLLATARLFSLFGCTSFTVLTQLLGIPQLLGHQSWARVQPVELLPSKSKSCTNSMIASTVHVGASGVGAGNKVTAYVQHSSRRQSQNKSELKTDTPTT